MHLRPGFLSGSRSFRLKFYKNHRIAHCVPRVLSGQAVNMTSDFNLLPKVRLCWPVAFHLHER